MDVNETAKTLAKLLRKQARLMARMTALQTELTAVQAEQCALLQTVVPEAGLDPEVAALVVAPKDDGED